MTLRTFFKMLPGLAAIPKVIANVTKQNMTTGWDACADGSFHCVVYPNTLVSNGSSVWFEKQESVYYFNPHFA